MSITVRAITREEVTRFRNQLLHSFGFDADPDERGVERFCELVELPRTYAAFDGDELIGSAAAFAFELNVPGGAVPMGGLTMVSVRPTHRRRGIMRQMIEAHIADVAARGEPFSGLWASEATIYQRFGYGVAAEGQVLRFDASRLQVPPPPAGDALVLVDVDAARDILPALYDRIRAARPGMYSRSRAWWEHRHEYDPAHRRGGASARRIVVARRDGTATGWVIYRQRASWDDAGSTGGLEVIELVAADATAEHSLWHYVTNVDLFPNIKWWNAPLDTRLPWLTPQRRHLERRRTDTLWLRPMDIAAVLSSRRYAWDGPLTIGVEGESYRLEVNDGAAACARIDAAPELDLDRAALGSIFLGNVTPSLLAGAGRVRGADAVLARADRLFGWPVAPWCPEIF